MIEVIDLYKSFNSLQILKGINLRIKPSEIVSIVGASGTGKTTLLQIIGTLNRADKGEVWIHGKETTKMTETQIANFRNKEIGFVFQFHHLLAEFSAIENACIPAFIAKKTKKEAVKEAEELFEILQISERKHHKPSELSGGEQQRVAVARALINKPSIILADEPSGNLDSQNAKDLHNLFFSLRERYKQTFLIVTHNEELANMSDRKLLMKDGIIIE
ncbi:MAG: ABC transporter ATP-binding protein [Bacteroidales bacterium]|jgi:lipoprotein-releasing system ATP-binding protein|nr:ABC transporter ATP-binding protein [Bacteroidales bacterium]MDD4703761.1 ABC transporter ATP-binding protein [Bacteroidales bacterium]MDX9798097.1 ABC transporter ATP-binding protein [Bacteroidales bacterium]